MTGANAELVDAGDIDELVRHVGRLVAAGAWEELLDLRDRCRLAFERGRQLWPVASLAEYRLALEAPGAWAAAVVTEGAGHLGLGPLPEVAACRHRWEELAPYLPAGPARALTAHERVVRGEDLTGALDGAQGPDPLGLPLSLQSWEPDLPVASYAPDRAEFPRPALPERTPRELPAAASRTDDPPTIDALTGLVAPWVAGSNGRAEAVAVEGSAPAAVAALGVPRLRLAEATPGDALAQIVWTAASGGAHGRRRGAAAGRFEAWWLLAALGGLTDEWPLAPNELGEIATELRWWFWDADEPDTGWHLRLAVEDPIDGLAWALTATDAA